MSEELGPPKGRAYSAFSKWTLERGIILGVIVILLGFVLLAFVSLDWAQNGFGGLEPADTVRPVIVAVTMMAIGLQTVIMSFLYSMLSIPRRK